MRPRFAVLLFAFSFSAHAQAQEGHLGAGHDKWHQSFYNALQRPDGKGSCCNLTDCRPTSGRTVDDHYEVKVNGAWISVLPKKVIHRRRNRATRTARRPTPMIRTTPTGDPMATSHMPMSRVSPTAGPTSTTGMSASPVTSAAERRSRSAASFARTSARAASSAPARLRASGARCVRARAIRPPWACAARA